MTPSTVEFKHLNILTRDLERAFKFYTEVMGFKYVMNLGPDKIVLDAGGFDFFLERAEEIHQNPKFHFGLRAELNDLLAFAERLEKHSVPLTKGNNPAPIVYTAPDGKRTALYFQDPDGWEIEVYTAI
jgi:catechol 2,3-dioxygenase-like lactoylglutathione lyase family enzyme